MLGLEYPIGVVLLIQRISLILLKIYRIFCLEMKNWHFMNIKMTEMILRSTLQQKVGAVVIV